MLYVPENITELNPVRVFTHNILSYEDLDLEKTKAVQYECLDISHDLKVAVSNIRHFSTLTNLHIDLVGIFYRILLVIIRADGDLRYRQNVVEGLFSIWFHGANIHSVKYIIPYILGLPLRFLADIIFHVQPNILDNFAGVVQHLESRVG